jgi:hypothetical protein
LVFTVSACSEDYDDDSEARVGRASILPIATTRATLWRVARCSPISELIAAHIEHECGVAFAIDFTFGDDTVTVSDVRREE